jgi:isoaspartyl peptidase/L-asparaginase-like protein (Ntn-hydrolase superfamily)
MSKFAIAVHGGAGPDSAFIKENQKEYKEGFKKPSLPDTGY